MTDKHETPSVRKGQESGEAKAEKTAKILPVRLRRQTEIHILLKEEADEAKKENPRKFAESMIADLCSIRHGLSADT